MPLTSQLQAYVSATQTAAAGAPDLGALSQATHTLTVSKVLDLASGTGAGAADVLYSDTNTLAASANTDIDLAGALANAIGGTSVFVRVKGLYVAASAANTNNVVVGNATTNAWATLLGATHTLTLRPGAWVLLGTGSADATGYAVTAGTGDLLRIANSGAGTSVSYDIAIIGASA
jgi:hypothetical protein